MTKLLHPPAAPPTKRVTEVITVAALSAAMYRLQETGDPWVILWAAGAIILLTGASTIARALETFLARLFGIAEMMAGADADDEDETCAGEEASGELPEQLEAGDQPQPQDSC